MIVVIVIFILILFYLTFQTANGISGYWRRENGDLVKIEPQGLRTFKIGENWGKISFLDSIWVDNMFRNQLSNGLSDNAKIGGSGRIYGRNITWENGEIWFRQGI
jgi:hypothetical protein